MLVESSRKGESFPHKIKLEQVSLAAYIHIISSQVTVHQ